MDNIVISPEMAAKILGVTTDQVIELCHQGKLVAFQIRGEWSINRVSVGEYALSEQKPKGQDGKLRKK